MCLGAALLSRARLSFFDFWGLMKRTSTIAAYAASLLVSSMSAALAADDVDCLVDDPVESARTVEQRLLGGDDEEARFLELQPFTREIAAAGVVSEALAQSLAESGVPAPVLVELRAALTTIVDLDNEVGAGDRFYLRYRQAFTVEGARIGTARLVWAELRTTAKGTIALHRFKPQGGPERLWLGTGEAAGPTVMRLPLDAITVSSGFGMRPDPLDKPGKAIGPLPDPVPVAAAPQPEPTPPPPPPPAKAEPTRPARVPMFVGLSAFNGAQAVGDLGRPGFHRPLEAPRPAKSAEPVQPVAAAPAHSPPPPVPPKPRLFMHEGLDLVAITGTPIYAAADGVIAGAAPNGRYGNWVQIDHPEKVTTVYGHLSEFAPGLDVGTPVSQGDLIGFVGNTGRSTGAHLHFEILANGRAVNPLTFPAVKRTQLAGADLKRFQAQVKRSLEERAREDRVDAEIAGGRN
jgi:murein DD-endopeptidase MepM/ murein hydrolase activator NlpD